MAHRADRAAPYGACLGTDNTGTHGSRLKFTHIFVVVGSGVPAGHAESSPAIHGWVERRRSSRVPEGRLSDSVVPPGLGKRFAFPALKRWAIVTRP